MKKLHYYQALLWLGSLLAPPLHAAHYENDQDDEQKYPARKQQASAESFYENGDLTFFDEKNNNINQKELKEGLINLSQRIKAKENRKVYFFIGGTGAGKSRSIQALQGNKIKKRKETGLYESSSSSDDSDAQVQDQQFQDKLYITERIPRESKIPTVGNNCTEETDRTYIYYPDPRDLKYKGIAFADTEGFFLRRKRTTAGKVLSAVSFPYTLKANKVGGIVLVISAPELDAGRGEEGLQRISSILQQYFAKGISKQKMRESILVMITKVTTQQDKKRVKRKLKCLIQLFYQQYYAKPDNNASAIKDKIIRQTTTDLAGNVFGSGTVGKVISGAANAIVYLTLSGLNNNLIKLTEKEKIFKKNLKKELQKQSKQRPLKLFYEILLRQDVPEDKVGDINNFKLDKNKLCFMLPWNEKSVQKILDKNLKNLKPIAYDNLYTFDNPVSQYIEASIYRFSIQLKEATQSLLNLRKIISIDKVKKELMQKTNKGAVNSIEALDKKIKHYNDRIKMIENDTTLEIVFKQSHYDRLPAKEGFFTNLIGGLVGYRLYKEFRYTGQEPIYKIFATYGPKAHLGEQLPSWSWNETSEFNFIKKNFKTIREENDNGVVIWQAEAKNGKSVKKDEWRLYHFTTGQHNAQCDIKFYARRNERISSKKRIQDAQDEIELLQQKSDKCGKAINTSKEQSEKWAKEYEKWKETANMLQFFADEILKEGAEKLHIKEHLRNYNEARKLFLPSTINKKNNQKNKSSQADLNGNTPKEALEPESSNQEPDDEDEVFDID